MTEKRRVGKDLQKSSKPKKRGRPRIIISAKRKEAAIKYVLDSGFWFASLSSFLGINRETLRTKIKKDKHFFAALEAANAEFRRKMVIQAKPEFILRNKFSDEFPDNQKLNVEHGFSEKLQRVLDEQIRLIEEGRKRIDGIARNVPTSE